MNLREKEVIGLACIRLVVKLKLTLEVSCNEQLKPQIVDRNDRHRAFPLLFILVDVAKELYKRWEDRSLQAPCLIELFRHDVVSDSLEYNPERLQVIEYLQHTVEEAVLLAVVI